MIRLIQRELKMGGRGFTIRQDSVGETYQLHCHDFYEFFLVTIGRALHVVNDTYQIVSRGSLVFVRPDDTHCYDYYKSQDFSFYNSGIPHAYYEKICGYYGSRMQSLDELPVSKHIHISDTLTRRLEEQLSSLRDHDNDRFQKTRHGSTRADITMESQSPDSCVRRSLPGCCAAKYGRGQ